MTELASRTIAELGPLLRTRQVSPVEVVEAVIARTDACNGRINAFISRRDEQARAEARTAEREIMRGLYRGPLHGIPLALKDNICVAGETTTMGSKIHRDFVPMHSATVYRRLVQAGAVLTGKLNLHEYAWGATTNNPHFGACHNPWDLTRIPGGSSGGSGAAVAADMTIGSLGTDTGGSIRIPSSFCGTVGLKPTHGLVSKAHVFPLGWSLDHVGPIVKSVHDAALLMNCLAGFDAQDPTSARSTPRDYTAGLLTGLRGVRVGINERYFFNNVDRPVEQAVRAALQRLQELGATVHEVEVPALQYSEFAELITIVAEANAVHHDNLVKRPQDFGDDVRFLVELGELLSSGDYLRAQQIRRQLDADFAAAFREVDVLVTPTIPFLPPPIGADTVQINGSELPFLDHVIRFTGPGNLTGLPALSLPCGMADGLPVGLQIMGPAFGEARVLGVAHALELTQPMEGNKPAL